MPHAGLVALMVFLGVLPFFLSEYHLGIVIMLFTNIILVVSFRLISTTGDWDLGHLPLMGVGAYFSALMVVNLGWPFWVTLPLAGLVAALVGLGFSYPLVRMKGFAFWICSFSMGEAMRLSWVKLDYPFRGVGGVLGIPRPSSWSLPGLPTIDFRQSIPYYFVVLVAMLVSLFIMYRIDRSRLGDTFKAIASQDSLAASVGINIARYRTLAYVIGAFFAGIAGALMAHDFGAIDPTLFSFWPLILVLWWVTIGGSKTFAGPIIGVISLTAFDEALRPLTTWRPLVYGFILILFLLFMPDGLESLPAKVSPLVKRLRSSIRRE